MTRKLIIASLFLSAIFSCSKDDDTSKNDFRKKQILIEGAWLSDSNPNTQDTIFSLGVYFDSMKKNNEQDYTAFFHVQKYNDFFAQGDVKISGDTLFLITEKYFFFSPEDRVITIPTDTSVLILKSPNEPRLDGFIKYTKNGIYRVKRSTFSRDVVK